MLAEWLGPLTCLLSQIYVFRPSVSFQKLMALLGFYVIDLSRKNACSIKLLTPTNCLEEGHTSTCVYNI